jgi:hypothetical protein
MGMLVTNSVGYRRINLLDKVIVVAMEFVWIDAYNRPFIMSASFIGVDSLALPQKDLPYLACIDLISLVYLPTFTRSYHDS